MQARESSVIRLVSATIVIGALAGAVIGGIGGRIAMRVLFVTTGDHVQGLTSDDGFEIGRFTVGGTLALLFVTALIGVLAALCYLVAHPFVAPIGVAALPVMAVFYGIIGGALMVHRGGVDFRGTSWRLFESGALGVMSGLFAFGAVDLVRDSAALI